jgi:serine/threonine protein kinase
VINGETFAFLDSELVADIDPVGKEMATISCPFNVTDFFASPEMLKIKELPSHVHYKTSYFSLGCLLLYALTECKEDFYKEYLYHEYLTRLHFKNTKLYWLLSRCLVEEPEKRSILFI